MIAHLGGLQRASEYNLKRGGFSNAFNDNDLQEQCASKKHAAHVKFLTLFQ
jgi:hypothetical protein